MTAAAAHSVLGMVDDSMSTVVAHVGVKQDRKAVHMEWKATATTLSLIPLHVIASLIKPSCAIAYVMATSNPWQV